ncbi:HIR complex subunit [Boothiomyces sp. JEL0866]|nr:HIR complex subunit [Boothiomyces sp. JEL0866]
MRIYTPDWVTHSNKSKRSTPIYSIHAHPLENKLATAGQDFNIKIWNLDAILDSTIEADESIPKLLSTLSLHDGAVLCVRWSPNGQLLASGSDDTKIVIWSLDNSNIRNTSFGSSTKNVESYRPIKVLMGHESDVADLSWSSDQTYLASCGFDCKVFIWDANTFERITCIDIHTACVKGVTWDPAGKFLATQSDDKSVKIFRTSDWKLEKELCSPYENVSSTTFFRRLSWSPDGETVASVNGESAGVCVAPIIYRDDWQVNVCLVGHEAPVEVALFNPHLFSVIDLKTGLLKQTGVVALGSQDNGISVWWTGSARAITSAQQLFSHSVLDLTWTSNGLSVIGCSYDGTIAVLEFEPTDFGTKISESEKERALNKYGIHKTKIVIPESIEILDLEAELDLNGPKEILNERMNGGHFDTQIGFQKEKIVPKKVNVINTLSMQSVSVKDGKKRIRPVAIDSTTALNGSQSQQVAVHHTVPDVLESTLKKRKNSFNEAYSKQVQYILPVTEKIEHSNLSIPSVRTKFTVEFMNAETKQLRVIECVNNGNGCQMVVIEGTSQILSSFFHSPGLLAVMTEDYMAITCADCTLHVFSYSGKRLFPPLLMQSAVSHMFSKEKYLLYISCTGIIHVWDINNSKNVLKDVSILPLLKDTTIESIDLQNDKPIITTRDKNQYIYSTDMSVWALVNKTDSSSTRILPKLTEIELNLVTSKTLNDPIYERWILLYARKLVDESNILKAKELVKELR